MRTTHRPTLGEVIGFAFAGACLLGTFVLAYIYTGGI